MMMNHSARQLHRAVTTLVEEGIRELTPSSFEISLPAELAQHTQLPPIATLNVTHTNIELHAKTAKTEIKIRSEP